MSEALEWTSSNLNGFAVRGLPSRLYDLINLGPKEVALVRLAETGARLRARISSRGAIFEIEKLTHRSAVFLALLYDGKLEAAYDLGAKKEVLADDVARFESLL
jgi:hypothetical protein